MRAWNKLGTNLPIDFSVLSVSLIVVARNEEKNISNLLKCIHNQNYPSSMMEVIIVDDNSTDNTALIVKRTISQNFNFPVLLLNNSITTQSPKKEGIAYAISQSKNDIVLITDADCYMDDNWVKTMIAYFNNSEVHFLSGPVVFSNKKGVWNKILQMEFMSLVASGAGSVMINKPIMCNGANMAFRKSTFMEVGGYNKDMRYASGDDVFLMHKIHEYRPYSICFAKNDEAFVYTSPPDSMRSFLRQRIRWASKSKGYTDIFSRYMALLIFGICLMMILSFIILWANPTFAKPLFILYFGKWIIDFYFFKQISGFFKIKNYHYYLPFVNLVYPIYVCVIAISSIIPYRYNWKGRLFNN